MAVLGMVALATRRVGEPDRPEAGAIGALRAITSAELEYASINDGLYDTPACLATPTCLLGGGGRGGFLDPELATLKERRGYRLEFHAGPTAESAPDQRRSRSAMTRFAVVAIPVDARAAERRAFCADDRQTIYMTSAGMAPRVEAGRCLDTSSPIH